MATQAKVAKTESSTNNGAAEDLKGEWPGDIWNIYRFI